MIVVLMVDPCAAAYATFADVVVLGFDDVPVQRVLLLPSGVVVVVALVFPFQIGLLFQHLLENDSLVVCDGRVHVERRDSPSESSKW